jgi:hypothetical protein
MGMKKSAATSATVAPRCEQYPAVGYRYDDSWPEKETGSLPRNGIRVSSIDLEVGKREDTAPLPLGDVTDIKHESA